MFLFGAELKRELKIGMGMENPRETEGRVAKDWREMC